MVGDSNDKTSFPHKLLFINTQVSRFRKAFVNGSSANTIFSETHLSKTVQLGGSIFNEMLGSFNPFKILNSVGNSVELYTEALKKKKMFL